MDNDDRSTSADGQRPGPRLWVWLLLGLASLGMASATLLVEIAPMVVTAAIEVPSLLGVLVLGALVRRPRAHVAESDRVANRRAASYLVAVIGFGSVLASQALRHGSVELAAGVLVLAGMAVAATVAPRIRAVM